MKKKTVSNLLCDIGKARDLIEERDYHKLYVNRFLFYRIETEVAKRVHKYYREDGELDFNMYDLQELSDEAYSILDELAQLLRFDGLKKDVCEKEPEITVEVFDTYCLKWSKLIELDAFLRSMAKRLAYIAVGLEFIGKQIEEAKKCK